MDKFYVYGHYKPNDTIPFNIGKGCGARAFARTSRNQFWHNIVNRYGLEVRLICTDMDEESAFWLEEHLISAFGRRDLGKGPLVNLTDGGGHINKGRIYSGWSEESNRRRSETMKQYTQTEEQIQKRVATRTLNDKWGHTKKQRSDASNRMKNNKIWVGRKHKPESKEKSKKSANIRAAKGNYNRDKITGRYIQTALAKQ
jgi:hypothetical protein